MKKLTKSLIAGIVVLLLTVGVVYAIVIFNIKTIGTVQEPLETSSTIDLPSEIWPGVEYPTEIIVNNRDVDGNGDQKIGITVTKSNHLVYKKICWNTGGGWQCANGDAWSKPYLIIHTVPKGEFLKARVYVVVPSDAKATLEEWVNFEVTRE